MVRLAAALGMREEGRRRQALYLEGEWIDVVEFGVLRDDVSQSGRGRVVHQATEPHFLGEEPFIVLLRGEPDGVMLREEGLDQDATRGVASASASRRLREELKGTLGGAKVGQGEPQVRGNHAHQRHAGEIVPLGDELRAHQDVDLSPAEGGKNSLELPSAPRHVAIQTLHSRAWEKLRKLLLDLFRAFADVVEVLAVAGRAASGQARGVAAIVADQAMLAAVIRQRDGAVDAAY